LQAASSQSTSAAEELHEAAQRARKSAALMSQRLVKEQSTGADAGKHLRELNNQILVEVELRIHLQQGARLIERCRRPSELKNRYVGIN
jgi:hypothetical protein